MKAKTTTKLHPELNVFHCRGGLFDVGHTKLHKNVRKRCRFLNPTCLGQQGEFRIVCVQKIYDGSLAYRVQHIGPIEYVWHGKARSYRDTFGRPARPSEIEIL